MNAHATAANLLDAARYVATLYRLPRDADFAMWVGEMPISEATANDPRAVRILAAAIRRAVR